MLTRHLAALALLTASSAILADTFDINLNNKAAQLQYGTASANSTTGQTDLHAGLLFNDKNSILVNAGLMVISSQDKVPGLSVGAGVEGLLATIKDDPRVRSNATAIALDGLARYALPVLPELAFAAEIHYAPGILSFGDATRYLQWGARVEYEITQQAIIYAGYRRITFDIKSTALPLGQFTLPSVDLSNSALIGLKLSF
jgi:opacity protein-like surface antigen